MKKLICNYCNNEYIGKQRSDKTFCSRSCSAKYNNLNSDRKRGNQYKSNGKFSKREQKCLLCGLVFITHLQRKYCSTECSNKSKFNKNIEKYELGELTQHKTIRKVLRFLNGWKCSICSRETWNDVEIPLVLDHIDGHSENNHKDNLRLVCPNCDALLPTYKSKNLGNGRASRRQRYNEGKSY